MLPDQNQVMFQVTKYNMHQRMKRHGVTTYFPYSIPLLHRYGTGKLPK